MGEKGDKTKELICSKAYQLFCQKGYQAVTMKDICEACCLSRGGLYRHYSSTREIIEEIFKGFEKESNQKILTGIENGRSAKAILEEELQHMKLELENGEEGLGFAIYEYSRICDNSLIRMLNQKARERWTKLIDYGKKQGEFQAVCSEATADCILYLYQGIRMWNQIVDINHDNIANMLQKIRMDLEGKI